MRKINFLLKKYFGFFINNPLLIGLGIIVIYFIPYIILRENSIIRVYENLDCEFIFKVLLSRNKDVFKFDLILPNIMGGLPVSTFPTRINVAFLFYLILPPLYAFLVNEFVIKVIAFLGMYLLIKNHILDNQNKRIPFIIAIFFCFIPFLSVYDLTTAGQPLLLFAFLNLLINKNNWISYAIIVLFGFYSSLALSGIFILFILFLGLLIIFIKTKKVNKRYLVGLILLALTYFISEFQLISATFISPDWISHRTARSFGGVGIFSWLKLATGEFLGTKDQAGLLFTGFILISTIASISIILYKQKNIDSFKGTQLETPKSTLNTLGFLALLFSAIFLIQILSDYITYWFGDSINILKAFDYRRFYYLLPLVWLVLFAVVLDHLIKNKLVVFAYLMVFLQFTSTIYYNKIYLRTVASTFTNIEVGWTKTYIKDFPTYKQFFDVELFSQIDKYIGRSKDSYRVVSIGILPSVALYNGYYTLDGYVNIYPLAYKSQFRKIISKEIEKSKGLGGFDGWGNRCYIFASELPDQIYNKNNSIELFNLQLDSGTLAEMGVEYIFSAVKINNYEDNNLFLEKLFEDSSSYRRIYLYRIKKS